MRESAVRIEKGGSGHASASIIREVREVMDIRLAAEYLGISADSLYRYASEGTIPAFRLGNRWRFKKSRLDSWMDEQSGAGESAKTKTARTGAKKPVRVAR